MLRIILFASVVATCFCQSAEAQLNVVDLFYDFKIEVRDRGSYGKIIYYDTHRPIVHFSQINQSWRCFPVPEEADAFLAANPDFELLESHPCRVGVGEWREVDSVETMEEALERKEDIEERSRSHLEVSIVPVYAPPTMMLNFDKSSKKQSNLPEAFARP